MAIRRPPPDLSNVGSGDFELRFTLRTSATKHSAIASQRGKCAHGVFWDIRMLANGVLVAETDGNGDYTVLESSANMPVNDGEVHAVVLSRRDGTLRFEIDGKAAGSAASTSSLGQLPALATGRNVCEGVDGTRKLDGTVASFMRTL